MPQSLEISIDPLSSTNLQTVSGVQPDFPHPCPSPGPGSRPASHIIFSSRIFLVPSSSSFYRWWCSSALLDSSDVGQDLPGADMGLDIREMCWEEGTCEG